MCTWDGRIRWWLNRFEPDYVESRSTPALVSGLKAARLMSAGQRFGEHYKTFLIQLKNVELNPRS
jgi:hypothetical protein